MTGRIWVFWVGIGGVWVVTGRDNRLCCLWFSIGLGVRGLWVSMFDVFWVLFGAVLGGGFWPQVSVVCVCVCARVAWRIWYIYGRETFFTNVKDVGKVNHYGVCLCLQGSGWLVLTLEVVMLLFSGVLVSGVCVLAVSAAFRQGPEAAGARCWSLTPPPHRSAQVKQQRLYTSTPLIYLHGVERDNITFYSCTQRVSIFCTLKLFESS